MTWIKTVSMWDDERVKAGDGGAAQAVSPGVRDSCARRGPRAGRWHCCVAHAAAGRAVSFLQRVWRDDGPELPLARRQHE